MPLTRSGIYSIIDGERDYQDSTFNPSETDGSGFTRAQRDVYLPSHILLLQEYANKAAAQWVDSKTPSGDGHLASLRAIAKLAAIAVRALERAGYSERLMTEGLR